MQHLWHHAKNLNAGYEETEYVYKNKKQTLNMMPPQFLFEAHFSLYFYFPATL